jgi:hypothetical protein
MSGRRISADFSIGYAVYAGVLFYGLTSVTRIRCFWQLSYVEGVVV